MHVDCHCIPGCPFAACLSVFHKSSVYQNFSTVCIISDSLRRRQTDASKCVRPDGTCYRMYDLIKPNKPSAFPGRRIHLDVTLVTSVRSELWCACHSILRMMFAGIRPDVVTTWLTKSAVTAREKKSTGWACHRLSVRIMRLTASVSFVGTT